MGMKKHALSVISAQLKKQVDLFLTSASAQQYLVVQAHMHAYQFAMQLKEEAVIKALKDRTSDQIVVTFAKMHEDWEAEVAEALTSGRARVIDIDSFRRTTKPEAAGRAE